jgi:hypothetical protein
LQETRKRKEIQAEKLHESIKVTKGKGGKYKIKKGKCEKRNIKSNNGGKN